MVQNKKEQSSVNINNIQNLTKGHRFKKICENN